jgi:hypothetical protein
MVLPLIFLPQTSALLNEEFLGKIKKTSHCYSDSLYIVYLHSLCQFRPRVGAADADPDLH